MTQDEMRALYLSLRQEKATNATIAAIAKLRLALIELVGEERQRELIGEWNEEAERDGGHNLEMALQWLASEGFAWLFFQKGMPSEWVSRHSHLWQYMVPDREMRTVQQLRVGRQTRLEEGDFANARNYGNHEIAHAVLSGAHDQVRELTSAVLEILALWRARDEAAGKEFGREYEVEEHQWLHNNAWQMARWGEQVQQHLHLMLR